jgi:hypothetical protein
MDMKHREYIDNPDPLDDDDPEYKREIFETYKYMGWSPEEIEDRKEREEYAAWLNESP